MTAITDFAKGKNCTARIPGVCVNDTSTTVWAHLNSVRWGSGRGIKAPDVCGLIACSMCHDVIDGRRKTDHDRDYIRLLAFEGHMESLDLLVKAEIVK